MDWGFGNWLHWVPKKLRAWPREETLPGRKVFWSSGLGRWPGKESHPSIGRDQARPPCHGCIPWLRCPSCCHRKRPSQQLGYPLERSSSHNHSWHLHLLDFWCSLQYLAVGTIVIIIIICAYLVKRIITFDSLRGMLWLHILKSFHLCRIGDFC